MPRTLKPHTRFTSNSATFSFYLGDCVDILEQLEPGSIDAIVTSPPYNLGIRYRSYDDTMPRSQYLEWTGEWVSRAARAMAADGSLFLNVGAKPTEPWTAIDIAQATRPHLRLQNTIHWVKSIAIEKALAGTNANLADDLAVGHYKPINSRRFLHDCHEFVFHFTNGGQTPIDRQAIGVRYQDRSRQHLVHPVRDDPEPRQGPAASRHLPAQAAGDVPEDERPRSNEAGGRPVPRARLHRDRLRPTRSELHRHRDGRGLSH